MGIKGLAVSSDRHAHRHRSGPRTCCRAGPQHELAHSSTSSGASTEEGHRFAVVRERIAKLREMSPLWEMYKDGIDLNSVQWAAH